MEEAAKAILLQGALKKWKDSGSGEYVTTLECPALLEQPASPTDVLFMTPEQLSVSDINNGVVQLYNSDGSYEKNICSRLKPYSLAVKKNTLVLTDRKHRKVTMFTEAGRMANAWGRDQFQCPTGLAISRCINQRYVVSDVDKQTVSTHDDQGSMIVTIGPQLSDSTQLCFPWAVACDNKKRIIVSNGIKNCIKIFSMDGELIRSFGKLGKGPGEFNLPSGLCVDSQDNILVADWGNHRVTMFSPTGEFIKHQADEMRHGIQNPRALALSTTGLLAVVEDCKIHTEGRVRLFQVSERGLRH